MLVCGLPEVLVSWLPVDDHEYVGVRPAAVGTPDNPSVTVPVVDAPIAIGDCGLKESSLAVMT